MFSRRQAIRWAELWVTCWNEGDLDTLLTLYREDVRFESPLAEAATGSSLVEGRDALERFWSSAPYGIRSVHLEIERVIWDPVDREMAIVYVADFDHTRMRGSDLITLDSEGRAVRTEACLGSVVESHREVDARAFVRNELVSAQGEL